MSKNKVTEIVICDDGTVFIARPDCKQFPPDYKITMASRIRLLRVLAGEPVFGREKIFAWDQEIANEWRAG